MNSDEQKLLAGLKAGNQNAYRELIALHQERLFRLAYGIILDREESLDIVQDVFLKVFQNISRFRGQSSLATWLHRMTVNHCLNWKRRWKRRFRWHHQPLEHEDGNETPAMTDTAHCPERLYCEKEFQARFEVALNALPEKARAVFVLKEIEGLSYEEIAATLGIKKGTVSSRLFYVRKKLKKALDPSGSA